MINIDKVTGQIDLVVSKAKLKIMNASINLIKLQLQNTLLYWKNEVRMLLNVSYVGRKNNTLYPFKREGKLRKSLTFRTLPVSVNAKKTRAHIRAKIIWDSDIRGDGHDYGEYLNSSKKFKHRKFFGWKNRTYRLLAKRLKRLI